MSVINDRLDFLSEVLQDFCTLQNLEFLSADDLLYDPSNELTDYQRDWLTAYCQTWDILQDNESLLSLSGYRNYIQSVNGLIDSMEASE